MSSSMVHCMYFIQCCIPNKTSHLGQIISFNSPQLGRKDSNREPMLKRKNQMRKHPQTPFPPSNVIHTTFELDGFKLIKKQLNSINLLVIRFITSFYTPLSTFLLPITSILLQQGLHNRSQEKRWNFFLKREIISIFF